MNIFTSLSRRNGILVLFSICGYSLIAQNSYYSIQAGAWNGSNIWSTVSQTGTACACNPSGSLAGSNNVYIYNNITATTLTSEAGSAKITVEAGESLTITATTFAMSASGVIIVNAGGTLIFNANVTMAGAASITNNGTIIVNSNITNSGSAVVTNNGTMNVYGNITTSGRASFGGTGTTYATGTVSGPGTTGVSVLPAFFSSFTNASGTGLVTYSTNPLAFNALQFNNNASTVLTGAGTFVPFPTQSISGTVNYIPLYTGTNSLGNSPISVVGGVAGVQYDTALAGMNFYSNGIIRLGGKYGYGISIQSNGDGINLYDNSPITVNSLNGSLSLESNADATLISSYGHDAIIGNDVIIQATGHADTGKHVYLIGSFPLAGNADSILSRNPSTGRITEIAKSSLMSSPAWGLTGNAGTVDGTDFIGTTDNVPFTIRTNNAPSLRLDPVLNTTFVGLYAGNPSVTGGNNIAIGYSALGSVTSGYGNIASGYGALTSNTTGSYNISIGYNALRYNNTDGNVAVGYTALQANTTGRVNAAMGYGALASSNADFNTAMGAYAGNQTTSGVNNTAIGFKALYSNITGSNNTAIGYGADVGSGNLSNATAIGYMASVNTSNSIVLGGTGPNAVNVGIGTNSPTQTLSITGTLNYTDGNQGLNKVLVSDGAGNATWKNLGSLQANNHGPVNDSSGTTNYIPYWLNGAGALGNSSMYFTGTNIGIGTTTPDAFFNIETGNMPTGIPMFSVSNYVVTNGGGPGNDPDVFTIDNEGNTNIAGTTTLAGGLVGTIAVFSDQLKTQSNLQIGSGTQPITPLSAAISISSTKTKQFAIIDPSLGTDYFTVDNTGNVFAAGQVNIGDGVQPITPSSTAFNISSTKTKQFTIIDPSLGTDYFTVDNVGNTYVAGQIAIMTPLVNSSPYALNSGGYINATGYYLNGNLLNSGGWIGSTTNQQFSGNVEIGTDSTHNTLNYKLAVCGSIRSKDVVIETGWCDYKLFRTYKRMTAEEKEGYIFTNHHLPDIDSGAIIESDGLKVGKNMKGMISNLEDNTMDIINLQKENNTLSKQVSTLKNENEALAAQVDAMQKQLKEIEIMIKQNATNNK
jgi:hypothetical protein